MGVLSDPSISWGATACSGSHPARVVFRRLIGLVLETICQITRGVFNGLCYCRIRARANLFRNAKMEDVPMADTRDAAPQRSAEFASLWSWSVELVAHRWDKHMRIRALFKLFQRKAVL